MAQRKMLRHLSMLTDSDSSLLPRLVVVDFLHETSSIDKTMTSSQRPQSAARPQLRRRETKQASLFETLNHRCIIYRLIRNNMQTIDESDLWLYEPLCIRLLCEHDSGCHLTESANDVISRSEERRAGKECRSRWSPYH